MPTIKIIRDNRLWIAHLFTHFGHSELLCGSGDTPELRDILLTEQFLTAADDHLGQIRESAFRIPWLWRPIRFAVNDQGRLGVQFKNRVTGKQRGMFFADEHSTFRMRRTDVTVTSEDSTRLQQRSI